MEFSTQFAGRKLIVKIGEMAGQANGSCVVQYGETVVLATATMGSQDKDVDFFPLTVEYEERFYAAGKIKGSRFIKRETRPPDEAILAGRFIDRSLRPLFNQELRREVQIINTVLATDQENDPDVVALYASILAVAISDIPWDGPIAGLRIGLIPSSDPNQPPEFCLNPTYNARAKSLLDLVISGFKDQILMIEAGAFEVSEETIFKAIEFGNKHLGSLIKFFEEIVAKAGKPKNLTLIKNLEKEKEEYVKIVENFIRDNAEKYLFQQPLRTKAERIGAAEKIRQDLDILLTEKNISKEKRERAMNYINKLIYTEVSRGILEKGKRIDGRKLDEIRPISAQVGILPRVHGSAIFQRGETQVLSTVTLGAPGMEQYLDTMEESGRKRFMHHYNFPPFCSGEVAPLRMTGRRETGHSALVEKGLIPLIPDKDSFPYTIRVVSEVLSSNGSTSMASTCASCLALMDAGVPIKKPVAGVAIGLASESVSIPLGTGKGKKISKWKIFTDLQDLEDGPGGMDFKVIGTGDGITGIQMDTKTYGLNFEIIKEALIAAKKARLQILDLMNHVLAEPRKELSPYAPRIVSFRIDPEKIRTVIGPGGKVINDIIAKTGVTIDIEQDGLVVITSTSEEAMQKAVDWIKNLVREIKVGEVFQGKVTRILDFGTFVELVPGHEGMVHVSEMAPYRIEHPSEIVKVGDVVPVKVIAIDEHGRIDLSMRAAKEPSYVPRLKPVRKQIRRPSGRKRPSLRRRY
ncbi:MAG: polyribonucleotide nucleotidyltransferase [Patescibacteria group bacterium]